MFSLGIIVLGLATPAAFGTAEVQLSQSYALDRFFSFAKFGVLDPAQGGPLAIDLGGPWTLKVGASAEAFIEAGSRPLFRVSDAAVAWRVDSEILEIALGRLHRDWSATDEAWGLGVFAPRFKVEPFSPRSDGLIGLHVLWKPAARWTVAVTGSPVTLPDQGPPMTLQNGIFIPFGPWAKAPQRQIQVGSQAPQYVSYDIQADLAELLVRPTVTGKVRYGLAEGFFASTTWSYGALHHLLMSAQVAQSLNLDEPTQVTLRPRMVQRWAGEGTLGFRSQSVGVQAAVLHEEALGVDTLSREISDAWYAGSIQDLAPSTLLSVQADWRPDARAELGVGYLWNPAWPANDTGLLAPDQGTLFDPRFFFRNAFKLNGSWTLPISDRNRWTLRGRAWVDLAWRGVFASTDLEWSRRGLTVRLGLDLVGSNAPPRESGAPGLSPDLSFDPFRRYRAHDRIRGEIAYAF